MFTSKKNKFDAAASIQRFLDQKRDLNSRFKHLNFILNSMNQQQQNAPSTLYYNVEKCRFFSQYRLEIFHLFYDFICHIESSLPGGSSHSFSSSSNTSSTSGSSTTGHLPASIPISFSRSLIDLEYALAILEQLLIYSPEILAKRWQYNAILTSMKKFLHPNNTLGLRRIAVRLFIIWYQIIGDDQECDVIFSSLVPHLPITVAVGVPPTSTEILLQNLCEKIDNFANASGNKVVESQTFPTSTFVFFARKIFPLAPAASQVDNSQKAILIQAYFEKLLESISVEFTRFESDSRPKFVRLQFLLDKIRQFYAQRLLGAEEFEFLNGEDCCRAEETLAPPTKKFESEQTLAPPTTKFESAQTLPPPSTKPINYAKAEQALAPPTKKFEVEQTLAPPTAKSTNYAKVEQASAPSTNYFKAEQILAPPTTESTNDFAALEEDDVKFLCAQSLTRWLALYAYSHRKLSDSLNETTAATNEIFENCKIEQNLNKFPPNFREMRTILLREKRNLHFLLAIFRFSFSNLPLKYAGTLGRAFKVLREWLQFDCDLPSAFFLDGEKSTGLENCLKCTTGVLASFFFNRRIFRDQERSGQTILICSRILSLFKYLANNAYCELSLETWTFLLRILLRIVENCVPIAEKKNYDSAVAVKKNDDSAVVAVKKKEDSAAAAAKKNDDTAAAGDLHCRLNPQLFQTLLVVWVLAGLNARLPDDLWCKLQEILIERRSKNLQLINEWGKVMDSLTKALALQLYEIDLNDLPSERLSEQKRKKLLAQGQFSVQPQNVDADNRQRQPLNLTFQFSSPFPQNSSNSETTNGAAGGHKILPPPSVVQQKSSIKNSTSDLEKTPRHKLLNRTSPSKIVDVTKTPEADENVGVATAAAVTVGDSNVSNADGAVSAPENRYADILSNLDVNVQPTLSLFNDDDDDDGNVNVAPPLLDDDESGGKIAVDDDVDDFRLPPLTPAAKNEKNVEEAVKNGNGATSTNENTDLNGPHLLAVIWRRILGCLGNMNSIDNPDIHHQYTNIVCRLVDTLLLIRQNQEIVQSTSTMKKTPILIPPYPFFAPFLILNARNLAPNFRKSKLLALDALCKCMSSKLAEVQYDDRTKNQFLYLLDDILRKKDTNDEEFCVLLKNCGLLYNFGFLSRDFCRYILRNMDLENTSDDSKLLAINCLNICLLLHYDEDEELIIDKLTHFAKCDNFFQTLHALRGLTIYTCVSMLKMDYSKPCLQTLLSNLENSDPKIANFTSQCLTILLDFKPDENIRREVIEKYLSIFQNYSNPNLIRKFLLDFCQWCSWITGNLKKEILQILLQQSKKPLNFTSQYVLRLLMQNFDRFTLFPCQINEFKDENWTILKFDQTFKFIFSAKICDPENFQLISRNETSKNFLRFTNLPNQDCKALKFDVNRWLKENFDSKNRVDDVIDDLKIENSPPQLPRSENADSASLERLLNFLQYTSPECFEKSPDTETKTCERVEKIATEIRNCDLKAVGAELNRPLNFEGVAGEKRTNRNCFRPFFDWGLNLIDQNRVSGDQWAVEELQDPKNEQLKRELKHFDQISSRQTHKMAVIFVANDRPMDKQSILTSRNENGPPDRSSSRLFEQFVARLGWEIDLNEHDYYKGGLVNLATTAPYYCTATTEILFHVSTRSMGDGDWTKKLRHIGNDEIHIVWCENIVDYRRNIIPTEFCDFLIVIYPLTANFRDDRSSPSKPIFRIHIDEKSSADVENDDYAIGSAAVGPLFDGALVDWPLLAPLVRATALNASRAKKTKTSAEERNANDFVEHRFEAFENLASKMKNAGANRTTSYNETIKKLWNIGN